MNTNAEQIVLVALGDISPSPYQSRRNFNESDLKELADSIKQHGVVQPALVRPVEGKDTPYELVAGERRWRASKIAGLDQLRCIIKEMTDDVAREINIIENVQRAGITPIEEARGLQELVDVNGGNKAEAARKIGKNEPYVYGKLALLNLPRDVQNKLDAGIINENVAKVILDIEPEEKQIEAAKFAEKLNLSASELRARMQKHISKGGGRGGQSESSGTRKPTNFKKLASSLVDAYESLEGFSFDELEGDEQGMKKREQLKRQLTLVRQAVAHAETALLRDPPAPAKQGSEGQKRPPRLSAA